MQNALCIGSKILCVHCHMSRAPWMCTNNACSPVRKIPLLPRHHFVMYFAPTS
uniref:Uncharacterized protein n=1 Tax=Anguilla anguilla TaxID=7936 RepID=A0A0E9VW60_ANGAN